MGGWAESPEGEQFCCLLVNVLNFHSPRRRRQSPCLSLTVTPPVTAANFESFFSQPPPHYYASLLTPVQTPILALLTPVLGLLFGLLTPVLTPILALMTPILALLTPVLHQYLPS